MSNYSVLKQDINNNIYENQTQQITGTVLNAILNEMTNALGAGYQFAGVATLGMNPGDPDQRVFYLAGEGVYTNFGGIQVPAGKLGVLKWDNRWTLQTIDGLGGGGANLTGYVSLASTDDLPDEGVATLGYLCGENLYLYVGEGGDTKEGKYQNCGSFRGPQGDSVQDVEQTQTSLENGGVNKIKFTLSNGISCEFQVRNGTTSSGLFPTLAALQAAYPSPVVGQYAFVGAGFPADIYVCTTAGTWTDSGEDYDGDNVDLTNYATKAEVTELEHKVTGLVTKELTWSNGFINVSGKIQSSTASKYTQPFLLKKGEKVTVGTRNTSITILGSTTQQSLAVGDTITVIKTTSTTDRYETYEYVAEEDIYIVACVRWSEHDISFYDTDCIEERVTNLESDVDKLSEENKRGIYSSIAKYSVVPSAFVPGLYWYKANNKIAHIEDSGTLAGLSIPIPVEYHDRVRFFVNTGNTQYFILAADDDGNVIESYPGSYISTLGGEFLVPSNATKLYLNTLQTDVHNSFAIVLGGYLDKMLNDTGNILDSLSSPLVASVQVGKGVNASTGEIVDDANQNAVAVDLSTINAKYVQFIWVASVTYGYGFVVNGVWQGRKTSSFPSGNYEKQTVLIPEGATEFRMSWNTLTYTGDNKPRGILSDAMEQALSSAGQVASLNNIIFKEKTLNVSNMIASGGVSTDGTITTNNTYGHIELVLNEGVSYKDFTFKRCYANPATHNCYGFVVNGQWIGYPGNASAYDAPTEITVDVPAGATVFKVCWNRNQLTDANFYLKSKMFENVGDEEVANNPVFQFSPDFNLNRVPTYPCPTAGQAGLLKPADLYAMYDALMATYPEYITKVDCDAVAQEALEISAPAYMDGLPIYMYKFSPKIGGNGAGVDQTSRVKVLMTSMHPQEKLGLYTSFYTAKMICENWANDVNAEQLRSLVDIYIMPCPWPWNMQNDSRSNYNGVNGNRNFPTRKWQESGQGTYNWTGTAPLTEYEAKVISYFLLQIKPDVSVDIHTSGNDEVGHMGIFNMNQYDQPLVDLCGIIARTTSNRAIQDNPNFPTSPDTCLYGVYPEDASYRGEFYQYAFEQGCRYSVLSEESPYSKWNNGVYNNSGSIVEQYTDGIQKEQVQYLFNTLLRLTRAACEQYYKS